MACANPPRPTIHVTMRMTATRAELAAGSIHTMSAMSQPAYTACSIVVQTSYFIASAERSESAWRISGSTTASLPSASAKSSEPIRFAASTADQSRPTLRSLSRVLSESRGTIGVSVFSVKSCWLPMITMRNPML